MGKMKVEGTLLLMWLIVCERANPLILVSYHCGERFIQACEVVCKIEARLRRRRFKRSIVGKRCKVNDFGTAALNSFILRSSQKEYFQLILNHASRTRAQSNISNVNTYIEI